VCARVWRCVCARLEVGADGEDLGGADGVDRRLEVGADGEDLGGADRRRRQL
jgi:hypothetical protein